MTLRSSVSLLASAVLCASVFAQDVFIDNPTYKKFYVQGVPNFDQRRENASVTIGSSSYTVLGLSNNGSEFCCPTSAIEWTDFLANRGWPDLAPGPGPMTGDYTSGVGGLGQYDAVDLSIVVMASYMGTSGTNGTYGGPAQVGAQDFYNSAYPGYFNTINIERDSSGFPKMMDMLNSSLAGNLIELYGGWYVPIAWNNTTAYYRNGGHCVAMPSATWNNNPSISFSICNPWTGDSMTQQSPQAYESETVTNASEWFVNVNSSNQVIAGSQQYMNVDFMNKGSNWILDGALEVQPYCGYTIDNGWIYWLDPIRFVNIPSTNVPPPYVIFKSPDGTAIRDATRNPLTGEFYYLSSAEDVIYIADPLSGQTKSIKTSFTPSRILFGASVLPFVLRSNGILAMWNPKTNVMTNELNLGRVEGLGYSNETDSYYFWGPNTAGTGTRLGVIYKPQGMDQFVVGPIVTLPIVPNGTGPLSVRVHAGQLWLFQQGDPYLYEIFDLGLEGFVTRYLPAVQYATSFSFDDMGHLYFSLNGAIVVTDLAGNTVSSPFNQLPGGSTMEMAHSVSNYRPWLQGTPAWNNTVPQGVFGNG